MLFQRPNLHIAHGIWKVERGGGDDSKLASWLPGQTEVKDIRKSYQLGGMILNSVLDQKDRAGGVLGPQWETQ